MTNGLSITVNTPATTLTVGIKKCNYVSEFKSNFTYNCEMFTFIYMDFKRLVSTFKALSNFN